MKKYPIVLWSFLWYTLLAPQFLKANNHRPKIHGYADNFRVITDTKLDDGEKQFLSKADSALALMEQAATKLPIKGVAIVAFIPGDSTRSWISKMKVVGLLTKGASNLLGVASTKAAEMAATYQDSGSGIRPPLKGEYGYQGGVIRKIPNGYIIAVFSGGSSAQDKGIAVLGADFLVQYLNKSN